MEQPKRTKKERIIELYDTGMDVPSIADAVSTNPTYVANTLIQFGRSVDYEDLYTTTSGRAYSEEARRLSGVLRFKNMDAARESVHRLDEAFRDFANGRNKRGMHRVQMLALVGKNRAEGIGKRDEAALFRDWLVDSLNRETAAEEERRKQAA